MKKLFSFSKRRKSSPSASERTSVLSVDYDLKVKGLSKVHKAAFSGDVAKLKQLAKKKDLNQLDEENRTALHIACVYGHTEVVQYLLENKAKLNLCDNQNCSALMKAVQCQQDHCVSILLEHEADPNLVDINGNTALHMVACIPSLPMAMKLLEHKANINAQNEEGNTPLILSVKEDHAEMVEFLLKEGADINLQNKEQRTPLLTASCNGQISMVQLLLKYNADITVKDNKGRSSDDYALMNGHLACSHLITEHERKRKPLQFALGTPVILKDGTEDNSDSESISRASESGPADSWSSTNDDADDDELDLGLKKPQKLNLKKLMSAFKIKGKKCAEDEKSLSDTKSEPIRKGNEVQQKGFLGSNNSTQHPVTLKAISFSNLPQMTSHTSLQKDGEEKSSLEDEYEKDHLDKGCDEVENKRSDFEHLQMNESSKDRDTFSGLGLEKEHEEEDSPWNSELSDKVFSQSDSDSPSKKEQRGLNSLINSHKPISSIYEENNDDPSDWDSTTNREASKNLPVYKPKEALMNETPAPLPLFQEQELGTSVAETQGAAMSKKEKGNESSLKGTRPVPMSDEDWNTDSISSSAKMTPPLPDIIETKTVSPPEEDRERDCSSWPNDHPEKGVVAKAGVMTGEPESSVLWSIGGSGKQTDVDQTLADTIPDRPNPKQEGMCDNGLIPLKDDILNERDHVPLKWRSRSPKRSATQIDHEKKRVVGSEGNLLYAHAPEQSRDACPVTHSNGGALSVFDDSTLSEVSEDERRFPSTQYSGLSTEEKNGGELEITDYFEDLTQSSDTTTEELDSPISRYFNTSLLIEQLETSSIDPVSMVKLQNIFHDYEHTIQKECNKCSRLAKKVSQLKQEQNELKCLVTESRNSKSSQEHLRLELETDLSKLKFQLKQEQEKHQRASLLYNKTQEQLSRKEEQHQHEIEEREKGELKMRNLELELRALTNNMKQLEEDRNETQRLLAHEKKVRALQEDLLRNHLPKQLDIEESSLRDFTKRNELTEASEHERELQQQVCILQDELGSLRVELEHFRSLSQQEESRLADERDALWERLEDAQRDLKLNDETLAQTIFQYNGQLSTVKAECVLLNTKLEHEKQVRQQLEAEAESSKARLLAALQETERCQAGHAEIERMLQHEREQHQRSEKKWTSESSTQCDTIQALSQKLIEVEARANSKELECHRTTLSLAEKNALLEMAVREREQAQAQVEELERTLQNERDRASRATARHDALQEKVVQIQNEGILLKQVQNRGTAMDVTDVQDCFTQALNHLHTSVEERVQLVEERSKELATKNTELQEQNYKLEQLKADREMSLWQLQQELANTLKKLSMCEASLEVNNRYRSDLEEEKVLAQKDMKRLKGKLQESEEQNMQVERRINTLMATLDEKERDLNNSGQKLQEVLAASRHTEQIIKQLEETAQRLEIENAGLEETVKQQNNCIEILQKGAQEATAVRNHLENLLTHLQSSKMTLEKQLSHEVQKQSMLSSNVHDWEEELKNQSRLGHRLAKLEKEKEVLINQMKLEKKKAIKITEQKKTVDAQLDQEMNRNNKLQKEMCRLRTLVKSAKKQLQGQNIGEQISPLGNLRGEISYRQNEREESFSRMKIKVDELQGQLEQEALHCSKLEDMNRELKEQLSSLKSLEHSHECLERNKQQLEEQVKALHKRREVGVMDETEAICFRIETEMRARQEIQQKLDEVNLFLQMQAANGKSQRAELEQRIRELEAEVSRVHTSQPASLLQRYSTRTELEHYRQLYNDELRLRKSLAAKLERFNERLAKANAKLLNEKKRSMSLFSSAVINGNLAGHDLDTRPSLDALGLVVSPLIPMRDHHHHRRVKSCRAKIHSDLEKNIT